MAQEQDDNFTELCNHVHGDVLTENPTVAQSAFGSHRSVCVLCVCTCWCDCTMCVFLWTFALSICTCKGPIYSTCTVCIIEYVSMYTYERANFR